MKAAEAPGRLAALEAEVRLQEDIEEIKQLEYHYMNCFNILDWESLTECFSENGVLDIHLGRAQGKAAILKLNKDLVAINQCGKEAAFTAHSLVRVDGDKAWGRWIVYFLYAHPRDIAPRPPIRPGNVAPKWLQGYDEMEYVREDGRWKISLLYFRTRLLSPMTLAGDEAKLGGEYEFQQEVDLFVSQ